MSGLHFAFLTTFYPPFNFGGDGIAVQRQARALVRAGHRVTVIHDYAAWATLAGGRTPTPAPSSDGVEVVTLRAGLGPIGPLLTHQTGRPVLTGRSIARVLASQPFDVIHYHNVSLNGGPGGFPLGTGIKFYTAHEHWLVCPTHILWRHNREPCTGRQCLRCQLVHRRPPQWWRRGWIVQRHLDRIDRFLALSEFSRRMHREFGFTREMDVLPPFPAEPRDAPIAGDEAAPHPRPYFLFVGRLERIKGYDDLLPAFAGPGSTDLVIAGEGQDGEALRRQTAGNPRVRHLGWVEGGDLDRWYRHAIALLIPSRCYETFGMIMLEAFRQSTPVIARRIGPFPEQVAVSGGGELFATHDELLTAMSRLAGDRAHRDALGRAGRAALEEHWSEAVILRRYLALVGAVAQARGNDRVASLLA